MAANTITRHDILETLRQALEPLEHVQAMWEGGAAAFRRVDAWSDIDLQVAVDDAHSDAIFPLVEQALSGLSLIELKYEIPQPTWHGHAQTFYRLRDTSPFLLIDFVVMKQSNPQKFLETEIHGQRVVHFDKADILQPPPLDKDGVLATIDGRLQTLQVTFPLFQTLTLKELHRDNPIEALAFYHNFTLRPLVELLRMKHVPARYNFHTRYVHYDLPGNVVQQLEQLFFVSDGRDLHRKREKAEKLFYATLAEIDRAAIARQLA